MTVKNDESKRLESEVRAEEQALQRMESELRLAEQAFDQFLQENDRKAIAAMKRSEFRKSNFPCLLKKWMQTQKIEALEQVPHILLSCRV